MSRARRGQKAPFSQRNWMLAVAGLAAAAAVVGLAALAQRRGEKRLQQQAALDSPRTAAPEAAAPQAADPVLARLLHAAEAADASVGALDAAAHALLVREDFEEADALVARTRAAFPTDAEAVIHEAVLRGVAGETAAARKELERLCGGEGGWEASLFLAGFALRDGDEVTALRAFRRFVAGAPPAELTPGLRAEIAKLEANVAAGPVNKSPQKQP